MTKNCIVCGVFFDLPLRSHAEVCPNCRQAEYLRRNRQRIRKVRSEQKSKRLVVQNSIVEIAKRTTAAGMTYGEYVAKMEGDES